MKWCNQRPGFMILGGQCMFKSAQMIPNRWFWWSTVCPNLHKWTQIHDFEGTICVPMDPNPCFWWSNVCTNRHKSIPNSWFRESNMCSNRHKWTWIHESGELDEYDLRLCFEFWETNVCSNRHKWSESMILMKHCVSKSTQICPNPRFLREQYVFKSTQMVPNSCCWWNNVVQIGPNPWFWVSNMCSNRHKWTRINEFERVICVQIGINGPESMDQNKTNQINDLSPPVVYCVSSTTV